jgi:hypothetical protein
VTPKIVLSLIKDFKHMSKNNYLDIKTIKKHARELRRNLTEEYDQFRDDEMRLLGLHVLRLKNEELFDMENTLL